MVQVEFSPMSSSLVEQDDAIIVAEGWESHLEKCHSTAVHVKAIGLLHSPKDRREEGGNGRGGRSDGLSAHHILLRWRVLQWRN